MNGQHERKCYTCGFPCEPPFTEVQLRSGGPIIHKGEVAAICLDCYAKLKEQFLKRTPDAPV